MKAELESWLGALTPFPGLLACGLRPANQPGITRLFAEGWNAQAADNAWRCAADVFRVLRAHRLPSQRLRWTYARAELHCARRDDDVVFAVFVDASSLAQSLPEVERLFSEFLAL